MHPCFTDDCWRVLIGDGRDCDGKAETHRRMTLTEHGPRLRDVAA